MKTFYKAATQRLLGDRPSPFRAFAGAAAAGTATGALVYKLLRSHEESSER